MTDIILAYLSSWVLAFAVGLTVGQKDIFGAVLFTIMSLAVAIAGFKLVFNLSNFIGATQ